LGPTRPGRMSCIWRSEHSDGRGYWHLDDAHCDAFALFSASWPAT
jgi:hypothetical protein